MILTDAQRKCLATLAKAGAGEQCSMGGAKRAHVLSACRALVRKGLAKEISSSCFIATGAGRSYGSWLTE